MSDLLLAHVRLRIARARLLLQVGGPSAPLADLLTFARAIGDEAAADSVAAFRAAQAEELQTAQAELAALEAEDE